MKLLLLGKDGQVGRALQPVLPAFGQLVALGRAEADLEQPGELARLVATHAPDIIVNAAAYTAVDKAETDEAAARAVNVNAVGLLAAAARNCGAGLAHVSTDFVFDGTAHRPYPANAAPNPLGVYGRTKLDGELAATEFHPAPLIVRTAWVYAAQGNNFVRTMLRLMSERQEIRVVADQIGTPTHAGGLARTLWTLVAGGQHGIWHWTDAGVASWYDFAVAVHDEARGLGLLARDTRVVPIRTEDYPTPAARPAFSVLDKTATWAVTGVARHWRDELRACLQEIARG